MAKYIKPTLKTKFHIDFNWWAQPKKNLRRVLLSHGCDAVQPLAAENATPQMMDWVDPETGQVFEIDQLWQAIRQHCADDSEFIPESLALTASIFRLFLVNDNAPLTPVEIEQQLGKRDARTILRTIGGKRVYDGIRAVSPIVVKRAVLR